MLAVAAVASAALIAAMAGCGGGDALHEVVPCERIGAAPGQQCELACSQTTDAIDAPACTGHHPNAGDFDCTVIEEFDGARGCCVSDGDPTDPATVILFAECE